MCRLSRKLRTLLFGVPLFSRLERLFYLSHMLHRWPGFLLLCLFLTSSPISVAVYMTDEESPYFDNFLKNTPLPHRLRLIQYRVLPPERARHHCVVYYDEVFEPFFSSSNLFHTTDQWGKNHTYIRRCENYQERIYPINRLRNLAIQNILTTHFLVLDMDMWPVGTFVLSLFDRFRVNLSGYRHASRPHPARASKTAWRRRSACCLKQRSSLLRVLTGKNAQPSVLKR